MPSSKNPFEAIFVPQEILALAKSRSEIKCNLRPSQRPILDRAEQKLVDIEEALFDTRFFYRPFGSFLKSVQPNERLILVCQSFRPEDIFSFITDAEIYWADNIYPRIDFLRRPKVVRKLFGESNLWGGFLLAAARVGRVKHRADVGYELLFEISKRQNGLRQ